MVLQGGAPSSAMQSCYPLALLVADWPASGRRTIHRRAQIMIAPYMPAVIRFWPAGDEFPSKICIPCDKTADRYLDAAALMFLAGGS